MIDDTVGDVNAPGMMTHFLLQYKHKYSVSWSSPSNVKTSYHFYVWYRTVESGSLFSPAWLISIYCGRKLSCFEWDRTFDWFDCVQFIKSPDTKQYTFEAVLLLAILADFHKSDAARLNPYLQQLKEINDDDLMRTICWAANFAINASVKSVISNR